MVYLTFAISVLTLVVLFWYACLTCGIEKAAKEQSEGLSKPALALRAIPPRSPTIDENFVEILNRKMLTRAEPNSSGCLELVNIGNGPALGVHCEIRDVNAPQGRPWILPAAYVPAGGAFSLPPLSGNTIKGKQHKIACYYDGLSGSKYESVIKLNGDEIEDWGFSRIRGR
jgi:hypothetical protein